jgi:hypothetical protein
MINIELGYYTKIITVKSSRNTVKKYFREKYSKIRTDKEKKYH